MRCPLHLRTAPIGFSLIEIVIALVILGILGVAGANMITSGVFTNQTISNEKLAYSGARYALERMGREIREMKYDSNSSAMVATAATADTLSFTKTGLTAETNVTLSYNNGTKKINLTYGSNTGDDLMLNYAGLAAGPFTYYKADGSPMTPPISLAELRYVGVTLSVTPAGSNQALSLSNLIYLRNR